MMRYMNLEDAVKSGAWLLFDYTDVMNLRKTMVAALLLLVCGASIARADDDGTDTSAIFEGEVSFETNCGHNYYGDNRTVFDFPHIELSGLLRLGKGWSLSADFEYERFYEDGAWCGSFKDMFSTNMLYVNKAFDEKLNVKGGILDIPVGITNSGGPALTIYDPESESGVLPMSWHETGLAVWGAVGNWRYEASMISCLDFPINRSCALGVAFRNDFTDVVDGLRIGAGGYWGKSSCGMARRCRAGEFIGTDGVFFGVVDFDFRKNGWIADGSAVYCTDCGVKSVGMEVGYDFAVLTRFHEKGVILLPFVRYDGVFEVESRNKMTLGANISPLRNLVLKVEYGHRRFCGMKTEKTFDVGIGYTIEI